MLCSGDRVVVFEQAVLRWVAETLRVVVDEGRATRSQGDRLFGGFVEEDGSAQRLRRHARRHRRAAPRPRRRWTSLRAALPG